jgi:nitrite reductase/ring-hydroxylating ferredoxin subunit
MAARFDIARVAPAVPSLRSSPVEVGSHDREGAARSFPTRRDLRAVHRARPDDDAMPPGGENGVVTFAVADASCLVADVDGEVQAFSIVGKTERLADRATVADGHVLCPLHGWPIDADEGRCGAAQLCRYEPLPVEVVGDEIRVGLPSP